MTRTYDSKCVLEYVCVLTETTNALSLNGYRDETREEKKKAKHPFGIGTLREKVVHSDVNCQSGSEKCVQNSDRESKKKVKKRRKRKTMWKI